MSLFNFFTNEPFADFDRLFDEAFARRTAAGGNGTQVQRQPGNTAPRVLLPRYAYRSLTHILISGLTKAQG